MCAQTEKTTFSCKDSSAKLYIYIGVGARDLYIDEAHMALDILRFAAFFFLEAFSYVLSSESYLIHGYKK